MLTRDGRFFHIDFGHFLGNFKYKYGYRRERAPFVFTPQLAAVMGGPGAPAYARFEGLCCHAYLVLRRHGHLLINLFSLMVAGGASEEGGGQKAGRRLTRASRPPRRPPRALLGARR